MFDRCRVWRKKLSRRTDGSLPPAQWGALEDHLAQCPSCSAAAEADQALHDVLSLHSGLLSPQQADAFDARVLSAVALSAPRGFRGKLARLRRAIQTRLDAMPLTFFSQIASGALVAASLTVICVFSALRPAGQPNVTAAHPGAHAALTAAYNEPPVPLESLLENPSPRAALLWTTPAESHKRKPASDPLDAPADQAAPTRPSKALPADRREVLPPDRG